MNRRQFFVAPLLLTGILEPVLHASPSAPRWSRDTADPRWVQGQVIVPFGAEQVWKRLERADHWWMIFSDIKTMRVTFRDADEWKLKHRNDLDRRAGHRGNRVPQSA